jgi:hypothetical protein
MLSCQGMAARLIHTPNVKIVTQIEALYKKHLLPGFDDRQSEERSIERLSDDITLVLYFQFYKNKTQMQSHTSWISSFKRAKKRLNESMMSPKVLHSPELHKAKS